MIRLNSLIRPLVQKLHAYVPGEQPKVKRLVKLNTNENPYPPSPKVLKAVREAVDDRLRLYPNPTSSVLREALAKFHDCEPSNIIIGNGSDDLLALAIKAFVEPSQGGKRKSRETVQYFDPSYSLYPVLADIHGASRNPVLLDRDFSIPSVLKLRKAGQWDFNAALAFVTTPNAPSGVGYGTDALEKLCRAQKGLIILDEAYGDFAKENALGLALKYPHVIVSRTFSKAYSLCFQRVGYFIGHPQAIEALDKVRDSYNVNGLGQVAALATLKDLPYYRRNFRKIIKLRDGLAVDLKNLGFEVMPSQSNFLLVKPPGLSAESWFEKLKECKFLVRWFKQANVKEYLRITIGSEEEMLRFRECVQRILR